MAARLIGIGVVAGAIGLCWIGLSAGQPPGKPGPAAEAQPPGQKPQKPAELAVGEEAIIKALDQRVALEFVDTPLADVVSFLEQLAGIEIEVDHKALDDAGVGTDTPVTRHVRGVMLRSALDLLLRDLGLTWTIRHEVLLITTPDEAQTLLVTKVYEVGDLVQARDEENKPYDDYDTLVDAITATVEPATWDTVGGPGSISGATFGSARVLVVSQTFPCHATIARLIKEIRAAAPASRTGEPPPMRPRRPKQPPGLPEGLPGMGSMPPGPMGGEPPTGGVGGAPARPKKK